MARVVAIVQARLGSTRLPKKVLASLGNECVIQRLLRNLQMVPELDAVALAVPEGDGELLDYVPKGAYATVFPGDENDVLGRYAYVARWLQADVIVRLSADCPLIDPALVSDALRQYKGEDYFWRQGTIRGVGDIELFSRKALGLANQEETDMFEREHCWRAVASRGKSKTPWVPDNIRRPHYRLCLDTADDLRAIRTALDAIGNPPMPTARCLVSLLDIRSDIVAINAHVRQASW